MMAGNICGHYAAADRGSISSILFIHILYQSFLSASAASAEHEDIKLI